VEDSWGPNLDCPDVGGTVLQCGDPIAWKPIDVVDDCDPTASLTLDCQPTENAIAQLWIDGRPAKLDTIVGALEDDRTTTACDQLAALQDQIRSWVDGGTLTAEQALPAQTSATNLQATLGCIVP